MPLVKVENLYVAHEHRPAVAGISFSIYEGETLGLVGESGCGKSTTAKAMIGLIQPASGTVKFDGIDIHHCSKSMRRMMQKQFHLVFQNASTSLNPRMTIEEIVTEGLYIHKSKVNPKCRAIELLKLVHLDPCYLRHYPHELSGGQQQRVCIARALCLNPKFIIFDESIAALDVSIQAQIINLLIELRQKMHLTYLFISHDLSMVKLLSNRIAVMHNGKIVEMGEADEIYHNPAHPYTQKLIESIPIPDPRKERARAAAYS